ncbi:hypothetical protein Tsubulata_022969 [Turnera subulata]|uniref:AB hydrolase-1 domain-containing protein n=1 Tax=Turnera subulata TaxID=218843 RepID=A0A9Q0FZD8_9ROSI|nr:hypothetical protein Tsubulata_022969 [Turnera subulata]
MAKCFSFNLTEAGNWLYRSVFTKSGLRSSTTELGDGTVMHCWIPKARKEGKPDLLLIHGLGANALWQWGDVIPHVTPHFNVYVPDLVFFGGSYSTLPDRGEAFQARCVMRLMEAHSVRRMSLVGLSYGGFVGYSLAAQFEEAVERVVICCAGVCMEEKDLREGVFKVSDLEEAANILLPRTPAKLKELVGYVFYKPPPLSFIPTCFLADFIDAICGDYIQEKKELIWAIPKDRKLSDVPKITQPTLIVWGDHDQVFPLELGHRLKRHVGDNAHLTVIKKCGHAFNVEKPREFTKILKTFLVDLKLPPAEFPPSKLQQQTKSQVK